MLSIKKRDLHEALLKSKLKGDAPSKLVCDGTRIFDDPCLGERLVLLSFTRFPKEFRDVLLTSTLAMQHVSQGVNIQPSWAHPGVVLATGVRGDAERGSRFVARSCPHQR